MSEAKPKTSVNFLCDHCDSAWEGEPDRVADAPDLEYHPYRYYAECRVCGTESPQASWERALFKAWANATGPKTAEGKKASASNLDGHPNSEAQQRTRFNAVKTLVNARTAKYFPAKPGRYAECQDCELRETVCPTQTVCQKKTLDFFKHKIAFDSGDPQMLMDIHADRQAAVSALIDDMICNIMRDGGTAIRSPEWYYDKDGRFHLASYVDENTGQVVALTKTEAHPLLKHLMDFINKNALTMADLEMTPKARDDQETLQGYLDKKQQTEEDEQDFRTKQIEQMNGLREMIKNSQEKKKRDPVLIEHGQVQNDE